MAGQGAWALCDQTLVSGTRFVTGWALARFTVAEEYGAYFLAFTTLIIGHSIFQTALVTAPLVVMVAQKVGKELRDYLSALAIVQGALAAMLASIAFLAGITLAALGASSGLSHAFLAMGLAAFFFQTHEFCRRVLFAQFLPQKVLFNDSILCTLQLAGIYLLWWIDRMTPDDGLSRWLSGANAFGCIAVASLAATLVGLLQIREFFKNAAWAPREALRQHWKLARSWFGAAAAASASLEIFTYSLSLLGGLAQVGAFGACLTIVRAANPFFQAFSNVVYPRAARAYSRGGWSTLNTATLRYLLTILLAIGSIVAMLALWRKEILSYLYNGRFDQFDALILILGAHLLVGRAAFPAHAALAAVHRTNSIFRAHLAGLIVALIVCLPLVWAFGPYGAAIGFVLVALTETAVSWGQYRKTHAGHQIARPSQTGTLPQDSELRPK